MQAGLHCSYCYSERKVESLQRPKLQLYSQVHHLGRLPTVIVTLRFRALILPCLPQLPQAPQFTLYLSSVIRHSLTLRYPLDRALLSQFSRFFPTVLPRFRLALSLTILRCLIQIVFPIQPSWSPLLDSKFHPYVRSSLPLGRVRLRLDLQAL